MDTAELIKKVRQIEIRSKGLSNQIFSGDYHSAFKGRGMSFADVRAYQYGDDIRNIDWNVTARTNEPFIKQFEEEREQTLMLIVDVSSSMYFGSNKQHKKDWVTEVAAVIAFSAIANNDKVGLILCTDKVEKYIPPSKGRSHILRIIRELIHFEPANAKTDLSVALKYFNHVIKKKSICFLISDFRSPSFEMPLKISARKHDFIILDVYDEIESKLTKKGMIRAYDAESGDYAFLDTQSSALSKKISTSFDEFKQELKTTVRHAGADMLSMETNADYIFNLHTFFKRRMNRR